MKTGIKIGFILIFSLIYIVNIVMAQEASNLGSSSSSNGNNSNWGLNAKGNIINDITNNSKTLNKTDNDNNVDEDNYNDYLNKKILNQQKQNLSDIELLFDGKLKQYGYEIFNKPGGANSGGISKSFKLSKGDKVKIYLWGDTLDLLALTGNPTLEPVISTAIDMEGNLFIPSVGIIIADGRSLSEVEQEISSILAKKYSNASAQITIEDPRNFNVMVMGNVKTPGTIQANSFTTIIDAISSAGGALKTGSLREIVYINNATKKRTTIDLYKLLINGEYKNINLKEGDVILVKPIGKVIGLASGVKTPAIYEFKKGESLKDIIAYAGGFLPSINPKKIDVESFDINTNQKQFVELDLSSLNKLTPKDGDMLYFKSLYKIAENIITIEGNIKHPGTFQFKDGMKLSDIIKSPNELLDNTNTYQAIIARVEGLNKGVIHIPISISDFFSGSYDPALKPQDTIKIYPATTMSTIEVSGKISNPSTIPFKEGMTLKDILSKVKFEIGTNDIVAEISNPLQEENNQTFLDPKNILQGHVNSIYLYELLTKNDNSLNIPLKPNDKILFRQITDQEYQLSAEIYGFVNNPGIYNIKPGIKISDLITIAGGLENNGYLKGIIFLRPSIQVAQKDALEKTILSIKEDIASKAGNISGIKDEDTLKAIKEGLSQQQEMVNILEEKAKKSYGRIVLNIASNDIITIPPEYNLDIKDGDQIIIPAKPAYVMVMGEVLNQNALAFLPDKTSKYYLDQVGGMTKEANKKYSYIVKANGITQKLASHENAKIEPGDSIIVPKKIKLPKDIRGTIRDVMQVGFQAASTIFMITNLKRN